MKALMSLLFSRLKNPNPLSFPSQVRCSSPLIILVDLCYPTHTWTISRASSLSCTMEPKTTHSCSLNSAEERKDHHHPWPSGIRKLIPLAFLTARAHCWLVLSLVFHQVLFCQAAFQMSWTQHDICVHGVVPPQVHFSLLSFKRFLLAHFFSLSMCLCVTALPAGILTGAPRFCPEWDKSYKH